MSRTYRHGSIVGPTVLVGIGAVLLLSNLGMLTQSVWSTLLDMWPVILVAAGLDLAIGYRSKAGAAIAAVLSLLVLAFCLSLIVDRAGAPLQTLEQDQIQVELGDISSADITLAPLAGRLEVSGLTDGNYLIAGHIYTNTWERVSQGYILAGEHASLSLRTSAAGVTPSAGWSGTSGMWDLAISPTLPLELDFSQVVGDMNLRLATLNASALKSDLVFGESQIQLPGTGRYTANISTVAGRTEVTIPRGLEASVRIDGLLVTKELDGDLITGRDGTLTTPGYGIAESQVELAVTQIVGDVVVIVE
jgi:hypothetical protein